MAWFRFVKPGKLSASARLARGPGSRNRWSGPEPLRDDPRSLSAQVHVPDCGLETCRGRPRQATSDLASLPFCVEHETRRPAMERGMTRLGRRSPSRRLAVPAVPCLQLAARGGQPAAHARAGGAVPDIIELILADHERLRRLPCWDDGTAGYGDDPACPGARPAGNAGAALAGVHARRAGAGSARMVAARSAGRVPGPCSPGDIADQCPAWVAQPEPPD